MLLRSPEKVPLRLSDAERTTLSVLVSGLKVSEYTNNVDTTRYNREGRIIPQLREFLVFLTGLGYIGRHIPSKLAKQVTADPQGNLHVVADALASHFELVRRFKRLNPHRLRSEYGQLLMMLQDLSNPRVQGLLRLSKMVLPIRTVHDLLQQNNMSELLRDPNFSVAVNCQMGECKSRLPEKVAAQNALVQRFGTSQERKEVVMHVMRSVDDAEAFLASNLRPLDCLIQWLMTWFAKDTSETSLRIQRGKEGSKLTHSHEQQRQYVRESLQLWKIVQRDMFDFWETSETDMTTATPYLFLDTGQGYHRVCRGPRTGQRMNAAIFEARQAMDGIWVGSTIVHLGDNAVPNAYAFIDKYTIIPQLTRSIVQCIDRIDEIFTQEPEPYPEFRRAILGTYKDYREVQRAILRDFFRNGFNASGGLGGDCIDGRLSSAWEWCASLSKKSYHYVFLLTGFTSFDADYNS